MTARVAPPIGCGYDDCRPTWANAYLWPAIAPEIRRIMAKRRGAEAAEFVRAFDLGCGNGATADMLARLGFDVVGVDPSPTGVAMARSAHPRERRRFEIGSAYDDLVGAYGRFPVVVSLEVIEHCYDPRHYARTVLDLLEPGGEAILSTPYHGYLKNLALAISGRLDAHFSVLWDGGHIKFFSIATLRRLLIEVGFVDIRILRVGRVPALAKSMVVIARRP